MQCNSILPSIAILNSHVGNPLPLPVKLDGDLSHCCFQVDGFDTDNLKTMLVALIDSGAVTTIGWLQYCEAVVLTNPSILVDVFTCEDGRYSLIPMQGVVDDNSGNTTDFTFLFQIQTFYFCRDGL